jgi:hypothetical protein
MSIDWEPLLTAENHNADSIVLDVTAFHHFNLTTPDTFLDLADHASDLTPLGFFFRCAV